MKLLGIIGDPLGHSMSPMLHNSMCSRLGIPAAYFAWPTPPERLQDFMRAFRTLPIHGCSVTIPHKEAVMPLCDRLSDRAKAVGAVNTLYWQNDVLCGDNTDVEGFVAPLREMADTFESALVLGAGGAARAAVYGLSQLGVANIGVANRNAVRSEALCADLGGSPVPWDNRLEWGSGLVVNTTPLGMAGKNESQTPWDASCHGKGMIAYDMVYNPVQTRFLAEAKAAGCPVVSGLEMFVHQAAAQLRIWTEAEMDIPYARELCLAALTSRG